MRAHLANKNAEVATPAPASTLASLATDLSATADLPPADLRWLLNAHNNAQLTSDAYWVPDAAHMDSCRKLKPWRANEDYFVEVKLSLLAALRMFIHSMQGAPDPRRGTMDWFEVMGLLVGHYQDGVLYVMDSFALPVEASQVECCMTQESQIHMADQLSKYRALGRPDKGCIGWYHTHPGYTCFLSKIDVDTQQQSQRVMDPYVALVVDPVHTLSTGQLHIKAFRTYTEPVALAKLKEMQAEAEGNGGGGGGGGGGMEVPSERIKERGKFAHYYYDLPITLVRSSADAAQLDALVAQYWGNFFASNALLANRVFSAQCLTHAARLCATYCHVARVPAAAAAGAGRSDTATCEGVFWRPKNPIDLLAAPHSHSDLARAKSAARLSTQPDATATGDEDAVADGTDAGSMQRREHEDEILQMVQQQGSATAYLSRAAEAGRTLSRELLAGSVQLMIKEKVFNAGNF